MSRLAELQKKEKELVDRINACRPTRSGILQVGGGITVCEDDDDWRVITMGDRMKLSDVRSEIARLGKQ